MTIKEAIAQAIERMPEPKITNFLRNAGVSHQTLRTWRNGENHPSPEHAVTIANLAGIDPAAIVLDVMEETAKTEDLRSVIADWKKRLSAALIAATFLVPALLRGAADCILCKILEIPKKPTA